MASKPRPTPHLVDPTQPKLIVWASDVDALKSFFPDAVAVSKPAVASKTVAVSGGSRRQYPGDATPVSRAGTSKTIYPEKWLSNGATPGRPFWCETKITGPTGKPITKRKQFTYQGAFSRLKACARDGALIDFVIRNASGAAYPVENGTP